MSRPFQSYPFTAKQYRATPPGEGENRAAPVAIVGAGPVGLATALGLARHGVRSVLIEADDGVCSGSRAICISRRSLEIIERLGALDAFLGKGLPWQGGRSFYRGDEVLHFSMPQDENQKLPPMINLAQYHIEQFLLDAAERQPDLIEIRWQTTVTSVAARADGVGLSLSSPAGDAELDCAWLVAADGGRSTVREALGLKLQGATYEGRYVIVDIALDSARPTERLAYFDPPSNPGSTVLVHKQPDNVWRIDYQLRDDEDAAQAILPENVAPRVDSLLAMMGETAPWAPIWISLYKANALSLEKYRHGPVLFAGDAAHLVPIFGVRGANSGIDDADNLAWKLAYVCRGIAPDSLLDSYSSERVHAARENLGYGRKSTEFMAPPSFAFELMRTAVLGLAVRHAGVRPLINPRQSSPIAYLDSPLHGAQRPWPGAGPRPGAVLAECPLMIVEDGCERAGHMTELVGPDFVALYFCDDGVLPPALAQLALPHAALPAPLRLIAIARQGGTTDTGLSARDHSGRLFALYGIDGTDGVYLVRPDGHVLARWREMSPQQLAAAVEAALAVALHRAVGVSTEQEQA